MVKQTKRVDHLKFVDPNEEALKCIDAGPFRMNHQSFFGRSFIIEISYWGIEICNPKNSRFTKHIPFIISWNIMKYKLVSIMVLFNTISKGFHLETISFPFSGIRRTQGIFSLNTFKADANDGTDHNLVLLVRGYCFFALWRSVASSIPFNYLLHGSIQFLMGFSTRPATRFTIFETKVEVEEKKLKSL